MQDQCLENKDKSYIEDIIRKKDDERLSYKDMSVLDSHVTMANNNEKISEKTDKDVLTILPDNIKIRTNNMEIDDNIPEIKKNINDQIIETKLYGAKIVPTILPDNIKIRTNNMEIDDNIPEIKKNINDQIIETKLYGAKIVPTILPDNIKIRTNNMEIDDNIPDMNQSNETEHLNDNHNNNEISKDDSLNGSTVKSAHFEIQKEKESSTAKEIMDEEKIIFPYGSVHKNDVFSTNETNVLSEEGKPPEISFEDALKILEKDFRLIEMLYLAGTKYTGITAIRHGYYKEYELWKDIKSNMDIMYNLSEGEFGRLKNVLLDIMGNNAKISLLHYYDIENKLFFQYKDRFIDILSARVKLLEMEDVRIICAFLLCPPEYHLGLNDESVSTREWLSYFNTIYNILFKTNYKGDLNGLLNLLRKFGLMKYDTWASASGNISAIYRNVDFFNEIKEDILKILDIDISNFETFLRTFEDGIKDKNSFLEFAGLDYIISNNYSVNRENIRDFLLQFHPDAWKQFEPNVINSKNDDIITILPFVRHNVSNIVIQKKREILDRNLQFIELLRHINNVDFRIKFDDKLSAYIGEILTLEKDTINIIFPAWFMGLNKYHIYKHDEKYIIFVEYADYENIVKELKKTNLDITLILIKEKGLYICSQSNDQKLLDELISVFDGWEIKRKEYIPIVKSDIIKSNTHLNISPNTMPISDISDLEKLEDISEIENENILVKPSGYESDKPGLLDKFIIKSSSGNLSESIPDEGPTVFILSKPENDNYSSSFQILIREVFRERVGGLPEGRIRSKSSERDSIKDDLRAEGMIDFIDIDITKYIIEDKIKDIETINMNKEKIGNLLKVLYTQDTGFIIFHVCEHDIDRFKIDIENLMGNLRTPIITVSPIIKNGEHICDCKGDTPKLINTDYIDMERKIARALYGFVLPKSKKWEDANTFDDCFSECQKSYEVALKRMTKHIKIGNKNVSRSLIIKFGDDEKILHRMLKTFVVKCFIEKTDNPEKMKNNIKTEVEIQTVHGRIRADITIEQDGKTIAIEIETLYGRGIAKDRFIEVVEKYVGQNNIRDIWIVIKNIDAFLYYSDIIDIIKEVKEERNIDVKFLTLDINNMSMIDIRELHRYVPLKKILNILK